MSDTHTYSSDVAFTPAVKAIQARKGSRQAYAHVEEMMTAINTAVVSHRSPVVSSAMKVMVIGPPITAAESPPMLITA